MRYTYEGPHYAITTDMVVFTVREAALQRWRNALREVETVQRMIDSLIAWRTG